MKKKIECLLLILTLLIAKAPLGVFATNNTPKTVPPSESGDTVLDGKIGEWDPGNLDQPDFNDQELEIEGSKPENGDYFTISVTVPVSMEFTVFPHSNMAFGYFYSPEYTIKNNGSKNITAKVKSFEVDNSVSIEEDEAQLHIEEVVGADGKTQMELKLTAIDEADKYNNKDIDLFRLSGISDEEKTLFNLEKNEIRKVKFSSKRWELPWFESDKGSAKSGYTLGLEFSISDSQ